MSILLNRNTRVMVQGITGRQGTFHATQMLEYGTKVVAGATPGRGGTLFQSKVPVFDSVETAVRETGANTSIIFVPAPGAADAILEAAEGGISLIICITEGVPPLDMLPVLAYLRGKKTRLIGPNCPGAISPRHKCRVGIMPSEIHMPGPVGVVSRSGTLTYEAVHQLTQAGIGQSTCVGIGGDPMVGTGFVDILTLFQKDTQTEAVVLIGEIGGTREQEVAEFIRSGGFTKPIVSVIVGQTAPPGKRMGHAGAIITGAAALASAKIKALADAGVVIAPTPADIGTTMRRVLRGK
ncbi:MAG: succinate--CoA ligase subunit alpha [Dehalococcoidia bacterium]|nr:succinate--CoA ligase subunit alpha [Dehalococcoidia bacterium]